jgi:hypothetical protein
MDRRDPNGLLEDGCNRGALPMLEERDAWGEGAEWWGRRVVDGLA